MLTSKDIQKLIEAFTKIFYTKEDIDDKFNSVASKEDFRVLQTSVDSIAVKVDKLSAEMVISNSRHKRAEDWIGKASKKIGIEFEL